MILIRCKFIKNKNKIIRMILKHIQVEFYMKSMLYLFNLAQLIYKHVGDIIWNIYVSFNNVMLTNDT